METYQVTVTQEGVAHIVHPSGVSITISNSDWVAIQQQRAELIATQSKKIADIWYVQVLDTYALMALTI